MIFTSLLLCIKTAKTHFRHQCVQWGKPAKTLVFMRVWGGLPYYNAFLHPTDDTSCFHIYLSPYFTNYAVSICKTRRFILREFILKEYYDSYLLFCNLKVCTHTFFGIDLKNSEYHCIPVFLLFRL